MIQCFLTTLTLAALTAGHGIRTTGEDPKACPAGQVRPTDQASNQKCHAFNKKEKDCETAAPDCEWTSFAIGGGGEKMCKPACILGAAASEGSGDDYCLKRQTVAEGLYKNDPWLYCGCSKTGAMPKDEKSCVKSSGRRKEICELSAVAQSPPTNNPSGAQTFCVPNAATLDKLGGGDPTSPKTVETVETVETQPATGEENDDEEGCEMVCYKDKCTATGTNPIGKTAVTEGWTTKTKLATTTGCCGILGRQACDLCCPPKAGVTTTDEPTTTSSDAGTQPCSFTTFWKRVLETDCTDEGKTKNPGAPCEFAAKCAQSA